MVCLCSALKAVGLFVLRRGVSLDGARTIEKMSAERRYIFPTVLGVPLCSAYAPHCSTDSTRQVLKQNPIGYRRWFLLPASVMGIVFLDLCWWYGAEERSFT